MTLLETFLKDVDRDKKVVQHMTRKEFNDYLTDRGYDYPTKAKKSLSGWRYINVFGAATYLDPDKRYGLVVYEPRTHMREEFYKHPEEALSTAPNGGLWQVLDMITGEVMFDIYNTNPDAKMESTVMNLTDSYLQHINEMEIRGDEEIYGADYRYAPAVVNLHTWPLLRFIYGPAYHPYRSIYKWGHYPVWWKPYRPVKVNVYHTRIVKYKTRKTFVFTRNRHLKTVPKIKYIPRRSKLVKKNTIIKPAKKAGTNKVIKKGGKKIKTKANQKKGGKKTPGKKR